MSSRQLYLFILFISSGLTAFSQKNHYIGFTFGTGSTFTKVSKYNPDNRYNLLKPTYSPSFTFGLKYRCDFTDNLSIHTGGILNLRIYKAAYPKDSTFGYTNRIQFKGTGFDMTFPLLLQGRLPLNKEEKLLYLCFTGGPSFSVLLENYVYNMSGFFFGDQFRDSIQYGVYSVQYSPPRIAAGIEAGIGLEKDTRKKARIAISIWASIGLTKTLDGEFYFYDDGVPYDLYSIPVEPPFSQPAAENDKLVSRNTMLTLRFDYFLELKKKK